jgi:hypothetical protein
MTAGGVSSVCNRLDRMANLEYNSLTVEERPRLSRKAVYRSKHMCEFIGAALAIGFMFFMVWCIEENKNLN